jgi:hypothetical protein
MVDLCDATSERLFGWMMRFRRLVTRYERRARNFLAGQVAHRHAGGPWRTISNWGKPDIFILFLQGRNHIPGGRWSNPHDIDVNTRGPDKLGEIGRVGGQ